MENDHQMQPPDMSRTDTNLSSLSSVASSSTQLDQNVEFECEGVSFEKIADWKQVSQNSPYQFDADLTQPVKTEREDVQEQPADIGLNQSSVQRETNDTNVTGQMGKPHAGQLGVDSEKTDMAVGQKQMSKSGACSFNIGSLDIFNKWWSIGSDRGLSTDTEIASFLISLYENTESAVQSAARCIRCHAPLTLICTKCQVTPGQTASTQGKPTGNSRPPRVSDSASETFKPGDIETGSVEDDILDSDPKVFATSSVQADTWDSLMSASFSGSKKKKKSSTGRKFTSAKSASHKAKGFGKIKLKLRSKEAKLSEPRIQSIVSDHEDDDAVDSPSEQAESAEDVVKSAISTVVSTTDEEIVKKYACDVCDAAFARSTHLKRHQRIHTGERPYICKECGHSFTRSTHLKRHELIHTRPKPEKREKGPSQPRPKKPKPPGNEKPFVCEECGSAFGSSTDLKIHRRIHTGEKPYLCKDCGAAFITSGNLRRHERTHSGDRPYLCQECCASFTRSADLSRHMKCHAGEKSYFCKECGAGFASFSFLRMHKRTHLEDMPYVCRLCNAAFCTSGSLKRHSQGHYGDIPVVF